MRRGAARERWLEIALLVGGLVAGLLLAETVLRVSGWTPERHRAPLVLNQQRKRLLLDCYPEDPRGYFPLDLRDAATRARFTDVPGVDEAARRAPHAVLFRYNTLHFRDVEPAPRTPGVARVVLLGDSFTEGQGVREEDTTARVLERLLNEGGVRSEVRNYGRRGHDFPKLARAFERVMELEPDLVVYAMVPNDPERSAAFEAARVDVDDWIVDRRRGVTSREAPAPPLSLLLALAGDRFDTWRVSRASTRWYFDLYGTPNREGWEKTRDYLRSMQRQVTARGGKLLVATWPLLVALDEYPFRGIEDTVARFLDDAAIPRHPLRPALAGRPTPSLWVHALDRHPNEHAHRLAAESLAPVVRGMLAR